MIGLTYKKEPSFAGYVNACRLVIVIVIIILFRNWRLNWHDGIRRPSKEASNWRWIQRPSKHSAVDIECNGLLGFHWSCLGCTNRNSPAQREHPWAALEVQGSRDVG